MQVTDVRHTSDNETATLRYFDPVSKMVYIVDIMIDGSHFCCWRENISCILTETHSEMMRLHGYQHYLNFEQWRDQHLFNE